MEHFNVQMSGIHGHVLFCHALKAEAKYMSLVEIPLADAGSLTTGPSADNQASFEISRLPKAAWRIREHSTFPLSCYTGSKYFVTQHR
jgi:hypothetical protein